MVGLVWSHAHVFHLEQMMPQGVIPQAQGVTVVQVQPISQQEPQNPASTDQPAAPTTADTPKASPSAEADAGPSPVPESQPKDQSASGGETKEASSDVSKSKEQEQKWEVMFLLDVCCSLGYDASGSRVRVLVYVVCCGSDYDCWPEMVLDKVTD